MPLTVKETGRRVTEAELRPHGHVQPDGDAIHPGGAASRSKADEGPTRAELTLNWPAVIWLSLLHVGALGAFFTFHWSVIPLVVFLHWLSGSLGICMGYHRMLTHSSFATYPAIRAACAIMGCLAGEGTPLYWVATHRQHHALSDHEGDPHSPRDGAWWSHMFWLAWGYQGEANERYIKRWAPDLAKDTVVVNVSRWFLGWNFLLGLILFGIGTAFGGWSLGATWVVWGVFVRLVAILHTTWFVNSASHIWGYKNYETTDDSRNLWWFGLLAYGEGWHNNHHAFPRMAAHGHRWWEVDVTYAAICLLEKLGLAWDVVHHQRGVQMDHGSHPAK